MRSRFAAMTTICPIMIPVAAMAFWYVYIARCKDGSLYTGIARDVQERIAAHDAGKGARYTRGRGPLVLLATRRCASHGNALRLELALKRISREEKIALVTSREDFARFARACIRRAPLVFGRLTAPKA